MMATCVGWKFHVTDIGGAQVMTYKNTRKYEVNKSNTRLFLFSCSEEQEIITFGNTHLIKKKLLFLFFSSFKSKR